LVCGTGPQQLELISLWSHGVFGVTTSGSRVCADQE
jgi:hypothetical protein